MYIYSAFVLMCFIFGTTFLAIKFGINANIPPFFFAGTRFLASGIFMILALRVRGKQIRLTRVEIKETFIIGIIMTTGFFSALYWGEQHISSGLAALLTATIPIMIAIMENSGSVTGRKLAGLCFGFIGVGVAALSSFKGNSFSNSGSAVVVIFIGQLFYSFGTIRSKRTLSRGLNLYLFNAYQMIFGSLGLLLLSLLTEHMHAVSLNRNIILSWLYLTILGSITAQCIYFWLVRSTNTIFPSTWTYISPIIAQFAGYLFMKEMLSLYSLLGLSLVLIGLFLINRDMRLDVSVSQHVSE